MPDEKSKVICRRTETESASRLICVRLGLLELDLVLNLIHITACVRTGHLRPRPRSLAPRTRFLD